MRRNVIGKQSTVTRHFFGEGEIEIFSAPGRSEIGGNHTDHQHGEVLAASINNDAIAVARKLDEPIVKVMSDGYSGMIIVQLDELAKKTEEEGTTNALIRGVLAKMKWMVMQLEDFRHM